MRRVRLVDDERVELTLYPEERSDAQEEIANEMDRNRLPPWLGGHPRVARYRFVGVPGESVVFDVEFDPGSGSKSIPSVPTDWLPDAQETGWQIVRVHPITHHGNGLSMYLGMNVPLIGRMVGQQRMTVRIQRRRDDQLDPEETPGRGDLGP